MNPFRMLSDGDTTTAHAAKEEVPEMATEEGPDSDEEPAPADGKRNEAYQTKLDFADLGITEVLCTATERLKWKKPTQIQCKAIPVALEGKDVVGLAETGSGKTGAFALPILQRLLETPQKTFALVLTPTRELAYQISEQFEALGASIGVKACVIVGGMDMKAQSLMLARKPHIIVATPGRLVDHLENTKGFTLRPLKCLVMDEADRILNMDFGVEVDKILREIPRERQTFLFSATMTKKVKKLQRAALRNAVKVEVSTKYQTVDKLKQYYLFIPEIYRDIYLVYILNELAGHSFMVFCSTCNCTMRLSFLLNALGLPAIPLHGQMSMNKRLGALNMFKSKNKSILLATDVASRGLDIEHVDVVINFDIPTPSKDYIHRVGRTARAGREGRSITFVTQYNLLLYGRIEHLIGKKLPLYETVEDEVMVLRETVANAATYANKEMRSLNDQESGRKRKRKPGQQHETGEDEGDTGMRRRLHGNKKSRGKSRGSRH